MGWAYLTYSRNRLGWQFGFTAIFLLAAVFGIASIVSVLMIPAKAVDNGVARGMKEGPDSAHQVSGFKVLIECKPLLILAAALACFHLGNGGMLPLYGLAFAAAHRSGRYRRFGFC